MSESNVRMTQSREMVSHAAPAQKDMSDFIASLPPDCRLPPVTELSERVTRIMGMNPGPMTLGGTNTYLVGKGSKKALIDTGDGLDSFVDVLKQHVAEKGITITDIILTHWHHDHVGGLRSVLELFPEARVIKGVSKVLSNERLVRDAWARGGGDGATKKDDPVSRVRVVADTLITSPEDLSGRCVVELKPPSGLLKVSVTQETPESTECNTGHYHAHRSLTSMSVMKLDVDPETSLLFIHTPGHTDDHVSLLLKQEHAIFSGDCVLGTGSSVFVCYSDFMSSLGHLERIAPTVIYPGHGPMVADGVGRIQEFITHRLARERQVLDFLAAQGGKDKPSTIMTIVKNVYVDVPEKMHMAAAGNVLHILKRMLDDKRVGLVDCTVLDNPTKEGIAEQDAYHNFLAEEEYHEVPDNGAAFEGEGSAVDWKKMTTYVTLLRWYAKPQATFAV